MKRIFNRFIKYGSGFNIEAERDYDKKNSPLIYHLRCYGLVFPNGYEIIGKDLEKLFQKAIKDAEKNIRQRQQTIKIINNETNKLIKKICKKSS